MGETLTVTIVDDAQRETVERQAGLPHGALRVGETATLRLVETAEFTQPPQDTFDDYLVD